LLPSDALAPVKLFEERFDLLADSIKVHREWLRVAVPYEVSGAKVHDARLVATMLVHGVAHVLTFNDADFARYPEIQAMHPARVAAG